jgi:two-component system chemotaxis response regulator CheB
MKLIRVLVVDDSRTVCKVISSILNSDEEIIVEACAHNGEEAVKLAATICPDIITMDITMPRMDGIEATREIMAKNPTPILIVSSTAHRRDAGKAFSALACGALDLLDRPLVRCGSIDEESASDLISKIKFLSKIKVIRHPMVKPSLKRLFLSNAKDKVIAICASTGGPPALKGILGSFLPSFPVPILVVQHIYKGFVNSMAEWLNLSLHLRVKIASDKEDIEPGTVYIAQSGCNMMVSERGKIELSDAEDGFKPSCDALLESVAKSYRENALAVILTGMGTDGRSGASVIKEFGGTVFAQDRKTSVIFGMPKAVIERGAADKVLPLERIPEEICEWIYESGSVS